jgi:ATP-dependent phosphoenolpyruvate carboxykinase
VLENVVFDEHTRDVDFSDKSVTGKYNESYIGSDILDGFCTNVL